MGGEPGGSDAARSVTDENAGSSPNGQMQPR